MKKFKKLITMILSLMLIFSVMPLQTMADTVKTDNKTHDYSEINILPVDYSYGTLFWSDNTDLVDMSNCSYYSYISERHFRYGAAANETICFKLTNCSIDKDGDICDVVFKISDINLFSKLRTENTIGNKFGESLNDEAKARIALEVTDYNGLIQFWYETNTASATYSMKYYKSNTNTIANIPCTVATIYDFDISIASILNSNYKPSDFTNELFEGNEGILLSNGAIYYDKSNEGYLIDRTDNGNIGISTPSEICPITSNAPKKTTSAVIVKDIVDATFDMTYSGYSCAIAFVFISPYTYELDSPVKAVDKNIVYEEETFNYSISQFVPNNYYADILHFIDNAGGTYKSFVIRDVLDPSLKVTNNITIINESNTDVSHFFDIDMSNNIITATLKSEYLKSSNFYSHLYTITIPACVKRDTNKTKFTIPNTATTIATNNNGTETINTNPVNVTLKYDITTKIVNGTITPTQKGITGGSDKTIAFTPNKDCYVSSVTVDGQAVDISPYKEGGSYTFSDINDNHTVEVICTPYEYYKINIKYLDEDSNPLVDEYNETLRAEKPYDVSEIANKTIPYYSLVSIEGKTDGVIDNNVNIIVRYKRNQNTVTINYFEKDTGNALSDFFNKIFPQGSDYDVTSTAQKNIPYYTYIGSDGNLKGVITADETINSYYIRNANTITINYLDSQTRESILEQFSSIFIQGADYNVTDKANKDILHYTLESIEGETSGFLTEDIVINVLYTRNAGTVTVNYIDDKGNRLTESETLTGFVPEEYQTKEKAFYGYCLTAVPSNAEGTFTEKNIIVDYIYTLKDTGIIVNYLDTEGNVIAEQITKQGKVFDSYSTSAKDIYGYTLISKPENAEGQMNEETIIINYIYELKEAAVIVNYVDTEGNMLSDSVTITGNVFDKYKTEEKAFHGYYLTAVPGNAEGTFTEEDIIVDYIYNLEDGCVIVKYIDEDGNKLCKDVIISGKVFEKYETSEKEFKGYSIKTNPQNASGEIQKETITVTYIYSKNTNVPIKELKSPNTGNPDTNNNLTAIDIAFYSVISVLLLISFLIYITDSIWEKKYQKRKESLDYESNHK